MIYMYAASGNRMKCEEMPPNKLNYYQIRDMPTAQNALFSPVNLFVPPSVSPPPSDK